jgi:putative transcriptional regulator
MPLAPRPLAPIAAALALACGLAAAAAAEGPPPRAGRVLVAKRTLAEPWFAETVVLLTDHGPEGSSGVIVNRPSERRVAELFRGDLPARAREERVFVGGPVEPDALWLLVRAKSAPPGGKLVVGDLYTTARREALLRLLDGRAEALRFRVYAGYAGWAPGQLDFEIARGDWWVDDPGLEALLADDVSSLWRSLVEAHDGIQVRRRAPAGARLAAR